ncbi:hypothetical protein [Candidatus Paracaedibacter symbiosus]|uniref:hypothetical protein n=1 Tax=Candidatus Paracaedibacter symbiosus TaxID=244582 RepID=UPI00050951BA|nr:hypothetical protein [Candidatus Paracaedibacter symbiosus]
MENIFKARYFKQGLLITAFAVLSSGLSHSFPQLQLLQQQLQAAQSTLGQEQAAHQQVLQNFNQCQADRAAAENQAAQLRGLLQQTDVDHTAALQQVQAVHAADLQQQQQQVQAALAREQQLQAALQQAQQGGGSPQQIAVL